MKAFYFLIPILMINGCKTQTATTKSSEKTEISQVKDKTDCPDEGTCTMKVHQDKTLEIGQDGIGATFPVINDGKNIVVEYSYFRKGPEGTADGNYLETIYFEIPGDAENIVKSDADLSDVKMLFGKQAYRTSGYYPVTDGKLIVQKKGNTLNIDLDFKIDETPQVISQIKQTVKIK